MLQVENPQLTRTVNRAQPSSKVSSDEDFGWRTPPKKRERSEPSSRQLSWAEVSRTALQRLTPGLLSGVCLGTWLRILRDNGLDIDPPYWGRALLVTLSAMAHTGLRRLEERYYACAVRRSPVLPPLFVLGLPRSGTTHLHNLLSRDRRLASPTTFEVLFPNTFLLTETILARIVDRMMGRQRPMDNVRFGVSEPQEDEWAMPSLLGRSCLLATVFPRNHEFHEKYLTLRQLSDAERRAWQAALFQFVRKLSYKYRRPLVLKSPGHTGRIRYLLELFPDARFVLIRRNPYAIFQSARHTHQVTNADTTYQSLVQSGRPEDILRTYRMLFEAYFEDRHLIPAGRLHELSFERLEDDPIGQLQRLYQSLSLPPFVDFEPKLRDYLESLRTYQKNRHAPLSEPLKSQVAEEWARLFDEWGYSR